MSEQDPSLTADSLVRAIAQQPAGLRAIASALLAPEAQRLDLARALERHCRVMEQGGPDPEQTAQPVAPAAPHLGLTARESDILKLIGEGLQVKQVAARLDISVSSVNTYRNRIFRKMNVASNAALIRYAILNGLVS